MHFDVFNGDADGILALLQLRLAEPKETTLITGVKRDISLVKQVQFNDSEEGSVTVLDVSMEKNQEALRAILEQGHQVFYVDHHRTGDIPQSENLTTLVNTSADVCTSLLIDEYLQGRFVDWAIAAAFGDNLNAVAEQKAKALGYSDDYIAKLKALGIYVNYNGYGSSVEDLHYHPKALYELLLNSEHPKKLFDDKGSVFYQLESAYHQDMSQAKQAEVLFDRDVCKVVRLPDAAWARRVSGVYGNELANLNPDKAHAVLTTNPDKTLTVSVRAPLSNKQGADTVCTQFTTGGGRAGAAGINKLPEHQVQEFIEVLNQYYK